MLLETLMYKFLYRRMFAFLLGRHLRVELLDYAVALCLRNFQTVFQRRCTMLHFHQQYTFQSLHPCTTYYLSFYYGRPDECEVVSHWGFEFLVLND